jgi:uncharacterized membrane protein
VLQDLRHKQVLIVVLQKVFHREFVGIFVVIVTPHLKWMVSVIVSLWPQNQSQIYIRIFSFVFLFFLIYDVGTKLTQFNLRL